MTHIKVSILDKVLEWSNKLLAIFSIIVTKMNLTSKVIDRFPTLTNHLTPEAITLILTVVLGIVITTSIYMVLINLSKITLNFLIFLKWATVFVLVFGVIYNSFIS